MNYSNFDKNTGRLVSSLIVPDDYEIPESEYLVVIGSFSGSRHYLDLVDMSVKDAGEAPSEFHYLTGMNGWVLDTNALEIRIRAHRDTMLLGCDWIEFPSAKVRMSEQQIQEWLDYRQVLRDVPSQEGFPVTVAWPVKP